MQARDNMTVVIPNVEIIKAALEQAKTHDLSGATMAQVEQLAKSDPQAAEGHTAGALRYTAIQGL